MNNIEPTSSRHISIAILLAALSFFPLKALGDNSPHQQENQICLDKEIEIRNMYAEKLRLKANFPAEDGSSLWQLKRDLDDANARKIMLHGVNDLVTRYRDFFTEVENFSVDQQTPLRELFENHRTMKDGIDVMNRLIVLEDMVGEILDVEQGQGLDPEIRREITTNGLPAVLRSRCQEREASNDVGLCSALRGETQEQNSLAYSEELENMIEGFSHSYGLVGSNQPDEQTSREERVLYLQQLQAMIATAEVGAPSPAAIIDDAIALDQEMGREIHRELERSGQGSHFYHVSDTIAEYRQCLFAQTTAQFNAIKGQDKDDNSDKKPEGVDVDTICHLELAAIEDALENESGDLASSIESFQNDLNSRVHENINRFIVDTDTAAEEIEEDKPSIYQRILNFFSFSSSDDPEEEEEEERSVQPPLRQDHHASAFGSQEMDEISQDHRESAQRLAEGLSLASDSTSDLNSYLQGVVQPNQAELAGLGDQENILDREGPSILHSLFENIAHHIKNSQFQLEALEHAAGDDQEYANLLNREEHLNSILRGVCQQEDQDFFELDFSNPESPVSKLSEDGNQNLAACLERLSQSPQAVGRKISQQEQRIESIERAIAGIKQAHPHYTSIENLIGFALNEFKTNCIMNENISYSGCLVRAGEATQEGDAIAALIQDGGRAIAIYMREEQLAENEENRAAIQSMCNRRGNHFPNYCANYAEERGVTNDEVIAYDDETYSDEDGDGESVSPHVPTDEDDVRRADQEQGGATEEGDNERITEEITENEDPQPSNAPEEQEEVTEGRAEAEPTMPEEGAGGGPGNNSATNRDVATTTPDNRNTPRNRPQSREDQWMEAYRNYSVSYDFDGNPSFRQRQNRGVMFAAALGKGIVNQGIPMYMRHQQNEAHRQYNERMGMYQKWNFALQEQQSEYMQHMMQQGYFSPGGFHHPFGNFGTYSPFQFNQMGGRPPTQAEAFYYASP